jgi:hypothetical protein
MRWNGGIDAIARCKRVSIGCGRQRRSVRVLRWICGVKPKLKAVNKPLHHSIVHGLDKPGSSATVSRLPVFLHGMVQRPPRAFHLAIWLIHAPAAPHRSFATMQRVLQLGAVFDAERQDTSGPRSACCPGDMGTFEAHGHGRSPSLFILSHSGRAYLKSPQRKTCDKTIFFTSTHEL